MAPRSRQLWSLGMLASVAGCSLMVDTSTEQCQVDADCAAQGGAFSGSVCSSEKVCVPRTSCTTHEECQTALKVDQAICRHDGVCAALMKQPECKTLYPPDALKWSKDELLLLGFMGATERTSYGIPHRDGAALAINEIKVQGVPGVTAAEPRRQIALLACDHGENEAAEQAVARHLVENLGVPAIIGASFSSTTVRVFDGVTARAGVLLFSPAATSPALRDVVDPTNLLWRTVPSDTIQTDAMKLVLPRIQAALVKKGTLMPGQPLRIAMPYKNDTAGRGLYAAIGSGAGAVQADFSRIYTPVDERIPADEVGAIAQGILSLKPHVIIHLGTVEFVNDLMPAIESGWTVDKGPRPWYLLPEGDRADELKAYASAHRDLNLHERLVGTAPGARRSARYNDFARVWSSSYQTDPGNLAEFAYDAVYLTTFAIGATQTRFPSGVQIARGLDKLRCKGGPTVAPGFSMFRSYFQQASTLPCLDYDGASGPLDFDDTGEAEGDMAVWCLRRTSSGLSFDPALDTYYSASDKLLRAATPGGALLEFDQADWCAPTGR